MDIRLLVIDPQEDFCNPDWGSLYVPGADKDMSRLSDMVKRLDDRINSIHVTLDQHHMLAIFHPMWWIGEDGANPEPFTVITVKEVKDRIWRSRHPVLQDWSEDYVEALEAGGRYPLCIWPYHCLIGGPGTNVVPKLFETLLAWERDNFKMVNYVSKGSNYRTEHYSAVKAEVPDPTDPLTNINTGFIGLLERADVILLAGEARSHCLANTVTDIADQFDEASIKKFILLTDATSDVPGFEKMGEDFVEGMAKRGMQVSTTDKVLI